MTLFVIVFLCALGLWWGARRLNRSQNPPPYPRPGYGRYRVNPYSADRNTAGRTTIHESWCSWAQSPGRDWGEFDTLDEARLQVAVTDPHWATQDVWRNVAHILFPVEVTLVSSP